MLLKFFIFTLIGFIPGYFLYQYGINPKLALILSLTIYVFVVFISKTIEFSEIKLLLNHSKHIIPLEFKGEPGLTLGTALYEGLDEYCGIINVGPFGCMPTRFTEAVAVPEMKVKNKIEAKRHFTPKYNLNHVFNGNTSIPFLTIEVYGNVFPQVIEARLETFALQADRISKMMKENVKG